VPKTVKIIVGLIIVGLVCSVLAECNPTPLVGMAVVAWMVWQVARGLGGVRLPGPSGSGGRALFL
jgi:hypothetical protein